VRNEPRAISQGEGSANRRKAQHKLARLHARIANIRKDATHKATTYLTKTFKRIGIEDLNVRGMVRNRHLARSIMDGNFGEFRRQLEYKARSREDCRRQQMVPFKQDLFLLRLGQRRAGPIATDLPLR
jgi:putative transposase